jgi:hypothetical protein
VILPTAGTVQSKRAFSDHKGECRIADGEVMRVTFTDCRVIRTSPDERELVLFCPLFNAILSGRNLRALADAIDAPACVWV